MYHISTADLARFLRNQLTDEETQEVMDHLNLCAKCRKARNLVGWMLTFSDLQQEGNGLK